MQKSSVVQPTPAVPEPAQEPQEPLRKRKTRVVRGNFKMPRPDFELIGTLKKRAAELNRPAKKNELFRAGLISLQKLSDAKLSKVLDSLTPLKAPRPMRSGNGAAIQ